MMEDLKKQAQRFGTDIRQGNIESVDFSKRPFTLVDDSGNTIMAESVIVATGASARWLGLDSEKQFFGMGVSACATCDGFFYRGQDVAVVGGGDTACEEAMYLSSLCKHVYLIVRRDVLRASQVMQDRVKNKENITILYKHQTVGLTGDGVVEGANLVTKHVKPSAQNENGGIVKREAPIHVSNVMIIDPKTNKVTRIAHEIDDKGKKFRISVKSKEILK